VEDLERVVTSCFPIGQVKKLCMFRFSLLYNGGDSYNLLHRILKSDRMLAGNK
jgi:hypothetical protein